MESQIHSPDFKNYNGFFNLTATFKTDSDFPSMYEYLSDMDWSPNEKFNASFDFHGTKIDMAVALISNCGHLDKSGRLEYIKKLQVKNFLRENFYFYKSL